MTEKDIHNRIFIVHNDIELSNTTLQPGNTYAVGLFLQPDSKIIELEGEGAGKLHNFTKNQIESLSLGDVQILIKSEVIFPEDILKQYKYAYIRG